MKNFMVCRRTFISTMGILALTAMAIVKGMDTTYAIMGICGVLTAGNAAAEAVKAKLAK